MRQRDWDDVHSDVTAPAPEVVPEEGRPERGRLSEAAPARGRARPRPDAPGRPGAGPRYGQDQYGRDQYGRDQYEHGDEDGYPARESRGPAFSEHGLNEHGLNERRHNERRRDGFGRE